MSFGGLRALQPRLARHPEYILHFTPTGAPWLNKVERFFAEITDERVRRSAFRSVPAFEAAIAD